jgi:hypothetical protein
MNTQDYRNLQEAYMEVYEQEKGSDPYDLILSHLLDEGYAETPEAAEAIMVNMSEEWRESILLGEESNESNESDEPSGPSEDQKPLRPSRPTRSRYAKYQYPKSPRYSLTGHNNKYGISVITYDPEDKPGASDEY